MSPVQRWAMSVLHPSLGSHAPPTAVGPDESVHPATSLEAPPLPCGGDVTRAGSLESVPAVSADQEGQEPS